MRLPKLLLLSLIPLFSCTSAKSEPKVSSTKFDTQPHSLFFFDDSETVLFVDRNTGDGSHGKLYRSTDAGAKWSVVEDLPDGEVYSVFRHPKDNTAAVAFGTRRTHWITYDQGDTWTSFRSEEDPSRRNPISWHAGDSKRILFHGDEICSINGCVGKVCFHPEISWTELTKTQSYYTTDGFKNLHLLRGARTSCIWAKTYLPFTTGDAGRDKDLTMCVVEGKYSSRAEKYRMVMSEDFFVHETEPEMSDGRVVSGMVSLAPVTRYIVAASKGEGTDEMALFVTDDATTWHRAEFGDHRVEQDAYTLLESTNYSIQVDVLDRPWDAMGVLFTSNSNGTYFTQNIDHTNRNELGFVDFEKIQNIQGIVLVNTVSNWEDVENSFFEAKKRVTQISFDDGRTFQPLKAGKDRLHLHSVTDQRNSGRVLSSPAPGLVMGVGNTGDYLKKYTDGDLYVSDDAGLTWRKAMEGAHKYEFGDKGSILVVAYDENDTGQIGYSIDHGRNWEWVKLDKRVRAQDLSTVPDSTSLKFLLYATTGTGRDVQHWLYSFDFSGLHERKCKDSDFEKWYARVDDDGKPTCIMGHKQWYRRRKADADCFIDEEFKDPVPEFEPCTCTEEDFECDYNFVRTQDRKDCIPAGKLQAPAGTCENIDGTFMGSSGWRLIPGDDCVRKGGVEKDKAIERPCTDTVGTPASGKITSEITQFKAKNIVQHFYLERADSSTGDDETVIMLTDRQQAYITTDHGKTWAEAVPDTEIVEIYPHSYFNDVVYLITPSRTVYYSKNRGKSVHSFEAPEYPNTQRLQIINFHPKQKDWLIWTGQKDCGGFFGNDDCHTISHVSTKGGEEWSSLLPFVQKCQFMYAERRKDNEQLVFCEQFQDEDRSNPLQLIASEDWFEHKTTHFENVVNFATMSEFIVVAERNPDNTNFLRAATSIDGYTFADAAFPPKFNVPEQTGYTVLDSSTHAVFLHVTVNSNPDHEYGSIIKSNSNGTSYVLSIQHVNRNRVGYVDFEKMLGLEGVAIVNVVANAEEVNAGAAKKLQTMVTHNDGAEWGLIAPPKKDLDGKDYDCIGQSLEKCALHLHGYTERKDPRNTFSSPSAIGMMLAVGNVGEFLGHHGEGDTFITRDGGVNWHPVKEGRYMWEYGDQGSVIVIVAEDAATKYIYYTRDEGETWTEYQFSETPIHVDSITTVPSDTSRNFLIWGREDKQGGQAVTVNLDFSGLTDKECHLNEDTGSDDSDYTLWSPKHPLQDDDCLFGHIALYHRKKADADCYNGRKIEQLHEIKQNCTCRRQDFEW